MQLYVDDATAIVSIFIVTSGGLLHVGAAELAGGRGDAVREDVVFYCNCTGLYFTVAGFVSEVEAKPLGQAGTGHSAVSSRPITTSRASISGAPEPAMCTEVKAHNLHTPP